MKNKENLLKEHTPKKSKNSRIKNSRYIRIWLPTAIMFILLCIILCLNELFDFPHLLFGSPETPINRGEIIIEMVMVFTVGFFAVTGLIYDIQEHKEKEEDLVIAYNALDSSIRGIIITDNEGYISFVNPMFLKLFNYSSRQELLGKNASELFVAEKDKKFADIRTIIEKSSGGTERFSLQNKEGKDFYIEVSSSKVLDRKGKAVASMASFIDITEREQMQKELARYSERLEEMVEERTAALIESEEKCRILVENANHAIFILQDDVIKFANPMTLSLTGYSQKELATIPFISHIHPNDRDMVMERHRERLGGEKVPAAYEFRAINKQGKELWFRINAVLITWEDQPATLCFLRDITQEKKLEGHLRQAQKMEAIGTLAGGIAHDFNNILFVILGYTEMSMDNVSHESPVYDYLEQVLKASNRAKYLIFQILTFCRRSEQEKVAIKIQPVIKEAIKLLKVSLATNIEIRQKIENSCGKVMGDPTQIHQIIMNLCTNAYHAMKEKGGILDVKLAETDIGDEDMIGETKPRAGRYIVLTVSDTGYGMPRWVIDKIFDPYFTTKPKGEGTGLGLAVVHGVVKSMNGYITVESEPGKGTKFQIYFPRIEADEIKSQESVSDDTLPGGQEHILVVDDEYQVAQMLREMLTLLGYKVTAMTDSAEALNLFCNDPKAFDLVITDKTMPKMTGLELSHNILLIRQDIPILLCSGFSDTASKEKLKSMGIQDLIMKPVNKREIAVTIHRIINRSKSQNISVI